MSRPLIGVTVSEVRFKGPAEQIDEGDPSSSEIMLGLGYARAIELGGGIPVAVPVLALESVGALLDHFSGLLISGGPDIDPAFYGAAPSPNLGPVNAAVDELELAICRRADEMGMPMLGICRGAQLLNVARGGTLHQHLPDITDGSIRHRQSEPGAIPTHTVRIAPDSLLAQTTGSDSISVNSFHHQGIERLGQGLRTVACSEDGMIEAVEDGAGGPVLGVQWHAETLTARPEELALFESLVEAARAWGRRAGSAVELPG
jgi:putative glutamine amidotransferase